MTVQRVRDARKKETSIYVRDKEAVSVEKGGRGEGRGRKLREHNKVNLGEPVRNERQ